MKAIASARISAALLRPCSNAGEDALWEWSTELILVNDGGTDPTLDLLVEWANVDSRMRVIGLARNFGHQAALTAGLDAATGDAIVIMDGDLQDPPELVPTMSKNIARAFTSLPPADGAARAKPRSNV